MTKFPSLMSPREQYLLATWPKQQAKGKTMYLAYNALTYAVIVGVVTLLLGFQGESVMDIIFSTDFLARMCIFTLIGVVIASFKWKANNKRYDKLKRLSEQEDQPVG